MYSVQLTSMLIKQYISEKSALYYAMTLVCEGYKKRFLKQSIDLEMALFLSKVDEQSYSQKTGCKGTRYLLLRSKQINGPPQKNIVIKSLKKNLKFLKKIEKMIVLMLQ